MSSKANRTERGLCSFYLNRTLRDQLKNACKKEQASMSRVIEELISRHLSQKETAKNG